MFKLKSLVNHSFFPGPHSSHPAISPTHSKASLYDVNLPRTVIPEINNFGNSSEQLLESSFAKLAEFLQDIITRNNADGLTKHRPRKSSDDEVIEQIERETNRSYSILIERANILFRLLNNPKKAEDFLVNQGCYSTCAQAIAKNEYAPLSKMQVVMFLYLAHKYPTADQKFLWMEFNTVSRNDNFDPYVHFMKFDDKLSSNFNGKNDLEAITPAVDEFEEGAVCRF